MRSATTFPWPPAPQIRTNSRIVASVSSPERLHGDVPAVADTFAAHNADDGEHQDAQVERETQTVDVFDIERKLLSPRERVASVDLRPTGDTRTHIVPALLLGG